MSNKPSQPSGERTTSSRTSAVQRSTEPTTSRKRSNTKYGVQPAIHLSLKTSTSALPRLQSHGGVNLNYDLQQATFGKRSAGSSSPSTASPSTGRSAGYSPSSNGSHTPASPLTASPDHMSMFSGFGDTISSSLPLSLSALWTEPSLDLVSPSPSSVSSSRRPSLSPYAHGHQVRSQPALAQSRSSNNLRLAAHRLPSDPASRKSSITSVERDAGLHLDMKRLLSKPAQPTHSGSSIMSLGSDSEPLRSPMYPGSLSRQPSSRRTATGPLPDERTRRPTEDTATLRKSASRASLHASALQQQQQPQKQRNVLRRKASATSNPATPTAQTFHQQQQQPGARISLKSFVRASVAAPPARRATHDVATTTTTSELPRRHKSPPVNLTPAGAVAHAYKQQARRRSELAEMSGGSSGDLRDGSVDSRRTTRVAADGDEGEESGGAYYTVLGGSAGRLIAVGSVEDSMWEFGYDARYGVDERFRQARVSSSGSGGAGVRGLGRKVSGKFKRPGSTKEHRRAHADELLDRRPKTSPGSSSSRPLGPSMDEYVDVNQQVCSGTAIPSAPNGTPEDKTLRSVRSFKGKEPDSNSKGSGDDSSPGGKIWKLMKRISTGALREKYHDATPPPPVPALPDDYKHLASPRTTLDIRKGRDDASETGISRFMNSRTSLSAVRPSTAPVRSSPRTTTDSSRPSTGPRHSTTTRSSSPMSSEVASSRYFQKSHSTHSSISSYGEELPPLPKPSSSNVGQHIMTPGELYSKLGGDELVLPKPHQQSRSRTRSLGGEGAPRPPSDIRPSLPPPRRSHTAGSKPAAADAHSHPPSPLIPAFDTTEPTNHFGTLSSQYSLPTSEFGVLNDDAPQRPKRSSRRKPPPFDLAVQTGPPVTPRTPRSPHAPPTITVDDGRSLDRKSLAGSMQSTIHDRDTLYSPSPTSATASHFRTPLRFREIDSPRVQLSEREKAAKWDDLLMRSEQAGGTLHLGDSGLMSDNVRFSEYSVSESPP
ncbi:uncharacterized protein PHACADRAFT_265829 [Phanerochaete carnosa HHB-10118-sp]|uniref:Uncharacterized protein n=1 Tax=Phanerochaete carnosa (strain HHB-10118-sp) TaxID=650164 RepID=K5WFX1_PHACS|nr:uncharacterized protein PHACADRAFT_265829 [Phanerochaete carnosa HHB-10118-sp]EKM49102.1 hypothetical protein PHACADRAFT_265829 [Phanerochaete carnosa HHB-10118-sp]